MAEMRSRGRTSSGWMFDNQSFLLDLKILFLTIKKVLVRDGISGEGEATMSKFTGNKN